jgi:hypothetical protein
LLPHRDAGGGGGFDKAKEELRKQGQADLGSTVNYVKSQTFVRDDSQQDRLRWIDARYEKGKQDVIKVQTYSDAYFELLAAYDWLGDYLAQGENVVLVLDDVALETTSEDVKVSAADLSKLKAALSSAKGL